MKAIVDTTALTRLEAKFQQLGHMDASPLMEEWAEIMVQDNRDGILAGLDKDGVPMIPVTYRPRPPSARQLRQGGAVSDDQVNRFRAGQRKGTGGGGLAAAGPYVAGINNNLPSAEYRLLGGPPLAPRGPYSRVITNYVTTHGVLSAADNTWFAAGDWRDVEDEVGIPFLIENFEGIGRPRRDLRGVRPSGVAKMVAALRAWSKNTVRHIFGG